MGLVRALLAASVAAFVAALPAVAQDDVAKLTEQLGDSVPARRVAAADALAALGRKAAPAAPALEAALDDRHVQAADAAGRALGGIGRAALPRIEAALQRQESAAAAIVAVEALGPAGAEAVPEMLGVFGKDWQDLRLLPNAKKAVVAIGWRAVKPLRDGLQDRRVAWAACYLLTDIGKHAAPAAGDLVALVLDRTQTELTRQAAAQVFLKIGPPARAAVSDLLAVAVAGDEPESVRATALGAIAAIGTEDPMVILAIEELQTVRNYRVAASARSSLQIMQRHKRSRVRLRDSTHVP